MVLPLPSFRYRNQIKIYLRFSSTIIFFQKLELIRCCSTDDGFYSIHFQHYWLSHFRALTENTCWVKNPCPFCVLPLPTSLNMHIMSVYGLTDNFSSENECYHQQSHNYGILLLMLHEVSEIYALKKWKLPVNVLPLPWNCPCVIARGL